MASAWHWRTATACPCPVLRKPPNWIRINYTVLFWAGWRTNFGGRPSERDIWKVFIWICIKNEPKVQRFRIHMASRTRVQLVEYFNGCWPDSLTSMPLALLLTRCPLWKWLLTNDGGGGGGTRGGHFRSVPYIECNIYSPVKWFPGGRCHRRRRCCCQKDHTGLWDRRNTHVCYLNGRISSFSWTVVAVVVVVQIHHHHDTRTYSIYFYSLSTAVQNVLQSLLGFLPTSCTKRLNSIAVRHYKCTYGSHKGRIEGWGINKCAC